MASGQSKPETLHLPETEARVLQLYDSLQQLRLDLALLRAQQNISSSTDGSNGSRDELLEAKAQLSLRDSVLEGVMMVQPLLEAVHIGTQASPVERYRPPPLQHRALTPRVEQRDVTATRAAKQSSDSNEMADQLAKLEVEVQAITWENASLASSLLELAAENQARHSVDDIEDMQLKNKMNEAEVDLVASRQRWKAIKGVTSAVVAGSGVDWARDSRLRDMVLDPPD
ncbi:centromere protein H (CENP-H)-domain-containing protein [Rhypophila decipiens]|uniref:Centromere protein H (CENP-H)-domain-containing protein n=1 Tax=Rhypophila decipiens TaxID=261697 RepID=A0AAN7B1Z8_9PEZI|nr:centromere protein H (CENP-H)-domain-containing protein [Rhypophila decipiens]